MRLPVMDPRDLLSMVSRVVRLLDEAEALLARIERTRQRADGVIDRVDSMVDESAPTLRTMASVAPDVHQILAALEGLTEALSHVPGLGRLKD